MDKIVEMKRKLREIVGKGVEPFTAEVKSVEGDTCTVLVGKGKLQVPDVRLKSTTSEQAAQNYLLLTPKVGTQVTVMSFSGDLNDLFVVGRDEVAKIEYKQDGIEFTVDSVQKKVSIKNQQVNLFTILDTVLTQIQALTVPTGTGPSGVPVNVTAFAQEQAKLSQLLF